MKSSLYNDRTYDGAVPQDISKKLKSKQRTRSKTPRNFNKKNKLSFAKNNDRIRNVRASTGVEYYPVPVSDSHSAFDVSPSKTKKQDYTMPPKDAFKSYDTLDKHNFGKLQEKEIRRSSKNSISQAKFKINPSPYKRREKSIDELIQHLQEQIDEIEMLEEKTIKKHSFGGRPKPRQNKKKKSIKARSHSPQEISPRVRKVVIAPSIIKKQVMKSIEQQEFKQPNRPKKIAKSGLSSRNKNTNATTIEGENRPLKMKSISTIKPKSSNKPRSKQPSITHKPKINKVQKLDIVKTLKDKVEKVKITRDQIYNKAAI